MKLDCMLSKRGIFFQICYITEIDSIPIFAEKASDIISVRIFLAEKIIILETRKNNVFETILKQPF